MSKEQPEQSLSAFDSFDLNDSKQRRLAVYALNDYYGAIFAEVGEALGFWPRDLEMGIKHQWNKTKSRLSEIENGGVPREYDTAIESVNEIRNSISHDFTKTPPREILEQSRELAPEWKDWINQAAETYEKHQESLTATEALVQVGKRTLENVEDTPQDYSYGLAHQQESLNDDANQLRKELESLSEEESVSRDLVSVISNIMELERDKDTLDDEHGMREEEVRREEELRRAQNTRRAIVTEEVGTERRIVVITDEVGKPDETYVLDVEHPETPDAVRDRLIDLETNDIVRLQIGKDLIQDRKGYIETVPYVEEIR